MTKRIQTRITYANVMATLALFIALGGASWAAIKLPAKSVGTKQIRKGAVTRPKLAKNAVTSGSVADGTLLVRDFAPGQLFPGTKGDTGGKGDPGATGPAGADGQAAPSGGEPLRRTVVLHGDGSPTANGTALLNAVAGVPATDRWLVKLEPGVYDLGTSSLSLPSNVDLEGSGDPSSTILSLTAAGTVVASSNTIRLVRILAGGGDAKAVQVPNGKKVTLQLVSLRASGSGAPIGLDDDGSGQVVQSVVSGISSGAGGFGMGIRTSGIVTISQSRIVASADGGGSQAAAINAFGSVIVTGSELTSIGSAGASSYGQVVQGGSAQIDASQVQGTTSSISASNGPIKVGASKLTGPPSVSGTGSVACAASYNGAYAPVGAACT